MKLQINIDGRQYEADIEVLEDEQKDAPGPAAGRPATKRATGSMAPPAPEAAPIGATSDKVCTSSIVGIVVSVVVKVGQEVKAGEPLLVLEAMKMESTVASPLTGRVKAVCVAQGESVKKGQVLVEFE